MDQQSDPVGPERPERAGPLEQEPPPRKPPRSALGVRDMVGAVLVLLPVVLLLAGLSRGCSVNPGGPTSDPSAGPTVDAPAELRALAPRVPFALTIPATPPGWKSNAVSRSAAGGDQVVSTGYVTDQGRYLRLVQSDASEVALLSLQTLDAPELPTRQGSVDVAGRTWAVHTDGTREPLWVTEVPEPSGVPVLWLITGSGSEEEFQALAAAVQTGEVLAPPE
ncbi:MAG TPA: DUF4245 domain-containing protein [Pseudonocardia sp.]|nr:DUF4245 domain-containing protein [Pseudonocardia sp.]